MSLLEFHLDGESYAVEVVRYSTEEVPTGEVCRFTPYTETVLHFWTDHGPEVRKCMFNVLDTLKKVKYITHKGWVGGDNHDFKGKVNRVEADTEDRVWGSWVHIRVYLEEFYHIADP